MAGRKSSCRRNSKLLAKYVLLPPQTPDLSFHPLQGPRPSFPWRPLTESWHLLHSTQWVAHPFVYAGPLSLQTKQNTRSFKMSAFNSLQLFPLRASPSVRGKHVACPQGEGRGAGGVRAGDARPSSLNPACRIQRAWALPGTSLLPCATLSVIFVTRGKVVLCCFRVWGGNFCAPTGDSACQLMTRAEAAAAPPSPCRSAQRQPLTPQAALRR